MHSWIFLSTVDASLDGLHISLDLASADILGVVHQGGFSSHSVYTRLMVSLSSDHWVCLFLQGEFPTPWTFGENLSTLIPSQGFLFLIFFVRHFPEEAPKLSAKYISCQFMHELLKFFLPLNLIGGLLSCCWVVSHVQTGQSIEGSAPLLKIPLMVQCLQYFSDKTVFWLHAAYWKVFCLTYFLLVSWRIRFRRVNYLIFDRILGLSVFHHVMWGEENKMEVIE